MVATRERIGRPPNAGRRTTTASGQREGEKDTQACGLWDQKHTGQRGYYLRAFLAVIATRSHLRRATRRDPGRCFGLAKRGTDPAARVCELYEHTRQVLGVTHAMR